jgi:hypothetical protein
MRSRPGRCACSAAISAPGYFGGVAPSLLFQPGPALAFLLLGLATAIAGSIVPARAAARAAPAVALRNAGDVVDPRAPVPRLIPALLLGLGAGAALLPAIGGLPLFGYVAMALLLAGAIAATPVAGAQPAQAARCAAVGGPAAELAIRHLRGAPGQAVVALSGIVASTGLMIAMAVMVTSFRGAVDDWLGQILSDDLYVRVEGGALDPAAQARLRATPGRGRDGVQPAGADPARSERAADEPDRASDRRRARRLSADRRAGAGPRRHDRGVAVGAAARTARPRDGRPHHPAARARHRLCGGGHLARLFAAAGGDHDRRARL